MKEPSITICYFWTRPLLDYPEKMYSGTTFSREDLMYRY